MRLNGLTRINTFQETISELTRVAQRRIGAGLRNTILISTKNCERAKLILMNVATPTPTDIRLDDDRVIATLHKLGVRYITVENGVEPYKDLPPEQLITALIRDDGVRVEYAVIPLLIRHTELASVIPKLVDSLPPTEAELLRRHYTAAAYLQRMYRPALELYLGQKPNLPDHFSREMNLPPPDEYYGEVGLRELIARLPVPVNWWYTYIDPVQMFIRALSLEKTYGWKS